MKLPAYPKYKPSGVEWLGDVPEHWEIKRLRYLFSIRKGRLPTETFCSVTLEGDLPYLSMEFLRGETDAPNFVAQASSLVCAEGGDLLLLWDGSNAGEFLKAKKGVVSSTVARLEIRQGEKGFLSYACKALESQIKDQTVGMGIPHVSGDELKSCSLPYPNSDEQRDIASFLDRETGRVDQLVTKKRELIERLKEKRTALISGTVTRGLNPNVKLKASDVEWLRDAPKHWEIKPVKFVARIGNGSTPSRENPSYWEEGDYPWLNSSVVNQEKITEAEEFVTTLALRDCHLPKITPPAVLIGITGQGRTRGMASTLLFEATINQHVAYLKPHPSRAEVGFLRRVFDMVYLFLRSESDGGGSTKGAITCEQIANLKIPLPPLPEQRFIAAYLDEETEKLDLLVGKVEEAVERLQEYRTSLITAAVTGKIDIRQFIGESQD